MQAVFPLALAAMFIVLVVLPQRRRLRAHQATLASLSRGHRVVTAGGIYGVIVEERGDVLVLSVADGVTLRVARRAVARRVWDDDSDSPSSAELGAADVQPFDDASREQEINGEEPR